MPLSLLNLPPEIITFILAHLAPSDLLSCQLSAKYLNSAILNSVGIQYNRALTLANAINSPFSSQSTTEKIRSLRKSENGWSKMHTDFILSTEVSLESGVYDLTGGIYLQSTADRMGLVFTRLPSKEGETVNWETVQVGKTIIDMGLCVYEHDLMAIVTSTERTTPPGESNTSDIQIELIEISSKRPHPRARNNPIYVLNSPWDVRPSVGIEIVGKHIVLVLSFSTREHPEDRVFIFEWETGIQIARFEARCHTYTSLLFLDENHFILPNTRSNTLDIYRIPLAPILTRLEPILLLALPPLMKERILGHISCRAEPNPVGKDSYAHMRARRTPSQSTIVTGEGSSQSAPNNLLPERDFLLESSSALCLFELRIHILMFHLVPGGGLQMGFPFGCSFSFVSPRSAFTDIITKHTSESGQRLAPVISLASIPPLSEPPTNENSLPSRDAEPSVFSQLNGTNDAAHNTHASDAPGPPKLLYDDWGPPNTRWFGSNEHDVSPRWITTSAGVRYVRMPAPKDPDDIEDRKFYIYDFNRERVNEARLWKQRKEAEIESRKPAAESSDVQGVNSADDRKAKGRSVEEDQSDAGEGSGGYNSDDGALRPARRDKGKRKAVMSNHSTKKRPTSKRKKSDDNQSSADEDMSAFDDAHEHEWKMTVQYDDGTTEEHSLGRFDRNNLPGSSNTHSQEDEGNERPLSEVSDSLSVDWSMDMFLSNNVDAMGVWDEQDALIDVHGSEGDDQESLFNDGDLEVLQLHNEQSPVIDYDHDHGSASDSEELDAYDADEEHPMRPAWSFDPLPEGEPLILTDTAILQGTNVFQSPIQHSLPCIVRESHTRHQWHGVLLDEERVIGVTADPMTGHVKNIEIHHFG